MYIDENYSPVLRCINGGKISNDDEWVSREDYEIVKRDCELWYKMWLCECKKRKDN